MEKFNETSEFEINPETGKIVSHGHEYANNPRMQEFVRRANKIRDSLPSIPENHTRLWRGNRPDEIGQNPSFTSSLEGIALPFLDGYGGKLTYIDIPAQDLEKYSGERAASTDSEFILSSELAKKAIVVE